MKEKIYICMLSVR